MEKKRESDASAKFIQALIKSVQTLCHGYLDFQSGIEIIGHINLSVDKGSSLDYILKEKVCRNAQNSTVYISNSFHAEAKEEEITRRKSDGVQCTESTISIDRREGGKVGYAISSISASLLGKHHHQRGSKESHKSNSKRRSSGDHSGDSYGAKIPHIDSRHDCSPRSKSVQAAVTTDSGNTSETLLPQTAGVGEGCGIGVNLAGSVLEPMGGHNDSDLHHEDEEDSDNDLEVTFIKEEYGAQPHGEDPGGDFEGGPQFGQRGLQDSSAPFVGGSFDQGHQFSAPDGGPSQPGPSGARGRACHDPAALQNASSSSSSSFQSKGNPSQPGNPWEPPEREDHFQTTQDYNTEDYSTQDYNTQDYSTQDYSTQDYDIQHHTQVYNTLMVEGGGSTSPHPRHVQPGSRWPYSCALCGKGFREREHFEGHVNVHNNVKAFQCPYCPRQYAYKTSLRLHINRSCKMAPRPT